MSAPPLRPSRFTAWLLRLVSSRDAANAAVGDVLEELDARTAADRVVRWPRLWLEIQTIRFTFAALASGMPRGLRAAGHGLRDAVRALRNRPATALFVVLILGVGISAATVTFTVVDTVLFRPLLLDPDERLVSINVTGQTSQGLRRLSPVEEQAICDRGSNLDGCA